MNRQRMMNRLRARVPQSLRLAVCRVTYGCVLSCMAAVVSASALRAQTPVDVGASVRANSVTHVRLQSGSVRITGWAYDSVHVSGRLAPGESWVIRADGDTMRLRAEGLPRGLAAPSELQIYVPMSSPLVVRAAAASLVVSEFDGDVDVATAAGNLLVESVRGGVRAETMQGTLAVIGPVPRVEASTASGAMLVSVPYDTINEVVYARRASANANANANASASANAGANASANATAFGHVVLRTISGRVTFDAPVVDSASIYAVRGDVRVVTAPSANGTVNVSVHTGRVTLGWMDGVQPRYNVRALRGVVRGEQPSPSGGAATSGSGGGVFTVRTVRGDVVYERVSVQPTP